MTRERTGRPDDEPNDGNDTMDEVAGELTAEMLRADEREVQLPPALAARLIAMGEAAVARTGRTPVQAARRNWLGASGWILAAAAVAAWVLVPRGPARPAPAAPATAVAALRDSLLTGPRVVRAAWGASKDPIAAGATGEVLWDPVTQRGVMRFTGLRANDPREAQYQLWIFDAARDERYPVDGGVFDIGPDGEVLVRIDARIPVQKATLFAVTLERPGGVVVSTRERLVLAAPVA